MVQATGRSLLSRTWVAKKKTIHNIDTGLSRFKSGNGSRFSEPEIFRLVGSRIGPNQFERRRRMKLGQIFERRFRRRTIFFVVVAVKNRVRSLLEFSLVIRLGLGFSARLFEGPWGLEFSATSFEVGGRLEFAAVSLEIGGPLEFTIRSIKPSRLLEFSSLSFKCSARLEFSTFSFEVYGRLEFSLWPLKRSARLKFSTVSREACWRLEFSIVSREACWRLEFSIVSLKVCWWLEFSSFSLEACRRLEFSSALLKLWQLLEFTTSSLKIWRRCRLEFSKLWFRRGPEDGPSFLELAGFLRLQKCRLAILVFFLEMFHFCTNWREKIFRFCLFFRNLFVAKKFRSVQLKILTKK